MVYFRAIVRYRKQDMVSSETIMPPKSLDLSFASLAVELASLAGSAMQAGLDVRANLQIYAERQPEGSAHVTAISTEWGAEPQYLTITEPGSPSRPVLAINFAHAQSENGVSVLAQCLWNGAAMDPSDLNASKALMDVTNVRSELDQLRNRAAATAGVDVMAALCQIVTPTVGELAGWNYAKFGISLSADPADSSLTRAQVLLQGVRRDEHRVGQEYVDFRASTILGSAGDEPTHNPFTAQLLIQDIRASNAIDLWQIRSHGGRGLIFLRPGQRQQSEATEWTAIELVEKAAETLRSET